MFKFLKKIRGNSEAEAKIKCREGVNALFAFLDEALPGHDPEGKGYLETTAQIFLAFYIIGMAKSWCQLMGLEKKDNRSQKMISYTVLDGLYYRYNLEFRNCRDLFSIEFFDPEKYPEYVEHNIIAEKIEQGREHFFYFMTLKYIPHNPLDLALNEWSKIDFYGTEEEAFSNSYGGFGHRGKIEGVFTKDEYKFFDLKMSYDLLDVDDEYERKNSVYLALHDLLEQHPFIRDAYPRL